MNANQLRFAVHSFFKITVSISILATGAALLMGLNCNAAETKMPDCVGIRLGISLAEVREQMQKYDPKLTVPTIDIQIPALGETPVPETLFLVRPPSETLQASVTLPPNNPRVWKVSRSLTFEKGQEQAKSALIAALHDKYGKESLSESAGDKICYYWVLGPDGSLVEGKTAREAATFCRQQYPFNNPQIDLMLSQAGQSDLRNQLLKVTVLPRIEYANPLEDRNRNYYLTYIVAELSPTANPELVNAMRVQLVDAALERKTSESTRAVIEESKTAKAQQEVEKAKQQKVPKL